VNGRAEKDARERPSGSADVEDLLSPVAIETMIGIGTTRQP